MGVLDWGISCFEMMRFWQNGYRDSLGNLEVFGIRSYPLIMVFLNDCDSLADGRALTFNHVSMKEH